MRILVTGANGQLGRALQEISREGEWIFTDLAELDVTNRNAVESFFDMEKPDIVVNCAAYTDVDRAETEPDAAFRLNCEAPRFLAEVSMASGAALVHISTDFVFRGDADRPYTEEDIPSPINAYGHSKLEGVKAMLETGCGGAVIRTSWLYSPWGRNFVKSILAAAGKNPEISVVSDQVSCPTSAASFADAIARMIPVLADGPDKPAELYHFCDAGVVSRAGFAVEIVRQAGLNCRIVPVSSAEYPTPARRPAYSALDTSKITRDFGIVPLPWQEALADCIKRFT
jgi:dTDP-4-dehydrorhamnose reductase